MFPTARKRQLNPRMPYTCQSDAQETLSVKPMVSAQRNETKQFQNSFETSFAVAKTKRKNSRCAEANACQYILLRLFSTVILTCTVYCKAHNAC